MANCVLRAQATQSLPIRGFEINGHGSRDLVEQDHFPRGDVHEALYEAVLEEEFSAATA